MNWEGEAPAEPKRQRIAISDWRLGNDETPIRAPSISLTPLISAQQDARRKFLHPKVGMSSFELSVAD
ncbi:MAG: hypothetical protein OGMRLDGQ_000146 [Candidatus Fervidibacter sp.]